MYINLSKLQMVQQLVRKNNITIKHLVQIVKSNKRIILSIYSIPLIQGVAERSEVVRKVVVNYILKWPHDLWQARLIIGALA